MTCENYMKFHFQCPLTKLQFYWTVAALHPLQVVSGCFHAKGTEGARPQLFIFQP